MTFFSFTSSNLIVYVLYLYLMDLPSHVVVGRNSHLLCFIA